MSKAILLPLLFLCHLVSAQAPVVSNLHYSYTEDFKSPKKTDRKTNWYNFNLMDNVLVITTEKPNKSFEMGSLDKSPDPFTEVIDKNINAVIAIFGDKKHYILEQLAMFPVVGKLVVNEDEEDQIINGFKCKCYKNPETITPGSYSGMGAQIYNSLQAGIIYKIWITTDIAFNDSLNPYMLETFRASQVNPKFKGVIVKIEKTQGYQDKRWTYTYELDTTKLHDRREKLIMPWNEAEPRIAMIEPPVGKGELFDSKAQQSVSVVKSNSAFPTSHNTGDANATCTGESHNERHKRMKDFLEKMAGAEKAKSTIWTSGFMPCNFWK